MLVVLIQKVVEQVYVITVRSFREFRGTKFKSGQGLTLSTVGLVSFKGMPSELYFMWKQYPWPFGDIACDAKIVISETVINASILIIVALTCER